MPWKEPRFVEAKARQRKRAQVAEARLRSFRERQDGPPEPSRTHPLSQREAVDRWLRRTRGEDSADRVSLSSFQAMEDKWQQQSHTTDGKTSAWLSRMRNWISTIRNR